MTDDIRGPGALKIIRFPVVEAIAAWCDDAANIATSVIHGRIGACWCSDNTCGYCPRLVDIHATTFPGLCYCWIQSRTQSSYPGKDLWEILPTLRVQMARWREMRMIAQVDN